MSRDRREFLEFRRDNFRASLADSKLNLSRSLRGSDAEGVWQLDVFFLERQLAEVCAELEAA